MTDPTYDRALEIVLSKITDEPTLLNQLPHDILRKLILCVGNLPHHRGYIISHGKHMLVSEVEKAINRDIAAPSFPPHKGVKISKCNYCDFIQLWDLSHNMYNCLCGECGNMLCSNKDCPGADYKYCQECMSFPDQPATCSHCIDF